MAAGDCHPTGGALMIDRPTNVETILCRRCRREMKFVRSIPNLGTALPELHIFLCQTCGEVETHEVLSAHHGP